MLGLLVMALAAVGLAAILGAVWLGLSQARIARAQDDVAEPTPAPPQPTTFSREAADPDRVGYYRAHHRRQLAKLRHLLHDPRHQTPRL